MTPICRAALVLLLLFALPGRVGANLTFDPPEFRKVVEPETKVIPVRFTVKNSDFQPRLIRRVKANCSCTRIDLKNKILQPGEQVDVCTTLTMKSAGGDYRAVFALETDDPKAPLQDYAVLILTRGKPHFQFKPNVLIFEPDIPLEEQSARLEVFYCSAGQENVPVPKSLKILHDVPNLDFRPVKAGTRYFVYDVRFKAPAAAIDCGASVRFVSNDSPVESSLPVKIHSPGTVRAEPPALFWGFLSKDTPCTEEKKITLLSTVPGRPLGNASVTCDRDMYEVIEERGSGLDRKLYTIRLKALPRTAGRFEGALAFTFDLEQTTKACVESKGYVR